MTKINQFRGATMIEANNLVNLRASRNDQNILPNGNYYVEDISTRYEKTCIKRLVSETSEYIEYEIGEMVENLAILEVLNARLATIERN